MMIRIVFSLVALLCLNTSAFSQNPQSTLPARMDALEGEVKALKAQVKDLQSRLPQSDLPKKDDWNRPPGFKSVPTVGDPFIISDETTPTVSACANGQCNIQQRPAARIGLFGRYRR